MATNPTATGPNGTDVNEIHISPDPQLTRPKAHPQSPRSIGRPYAFATDLNCTDVQPSTANRQQQNGVDAANNKHFQSAHSRRHPHF